MILGHQQARQVDLAAADVGVQVDAACHDDAATDVELLTEGLAIGRRNDATVAHTQIAQNAGAASGRIDHEAATQAQAAHGVPLRSARSMPAST